MTNSIVERVEALRDKPALLAWILGNEVGGQILQERGIEPITAGLAALYTAVKAADPRASDFARELAAGSAFGPSFPRLRQLQRVPAVAARSRGRRIRQLYRDHAPSDCRRPAAADLGVWRQHHRSGRRGQSRLLRSSWNELREAGAAGGVVFEFADEWWKNYNNPARPGDWWTRVDAPDDELRHDHDPEETYGVVLADRTPKPSFAVVSGDVCRTYSRTTRLGRSAPWLYRESC